MIRTLLLALAVLCAPHVLFAQASTSIHLTLGNPSQAKPDKSQRTNYLLVNEEWACSYNVETGGPNWVSWHLSIDDLGNADRAGLDFTVDPDLPDEFPAITGALYAGSGFDKGHGCPFADRTRTRAAGKRTFTTANCGPQAPVLNRGQIGVVEDLRREAARDGNELFIVIGPAGSGGRGEHGYRLSIGTAERRVNVPALWWASWISIPAKRGNALSRITKASEIHSVIFRNDQDQADNWRQATSTARDIEQLTELDLFDLLPDDVERALEIRR